MGLFNCFSKSSKSNSLGNLREKSNTKNSTPINPATQNSHFDNTTPAEAPPIYTPVATSLAPSFNFPQNAVPRTFSNDLNTQPQCHRPQSIASFTSSIPPHDPTADDEYGSLREIDTVILIDDSGSMAACDCRSNSGAKVSRWEETRTALESMLPVVTKRDPDGIDVYFLNNKSTDLGDKSQGKAGTGYRNITSVTKVKQLFGQVRPSGVTPTGQRIRDILTPYVKHVAKQKKRGIAVKKLNILCITDGVATDNLEEDIVEFARKLDAMGAIARQVGLQFFQVGQDRKAAEALAELDDDLTSQGVRDMVDTTTFGKDDMGNKSLDGDAMIKFVLGGINGRQDKKKVPG